jgi:hypothetical protein
MQTQEEIDALMDEILMYIHMGESLERAEIAIDPYMDILN